MATAVLTVVQALVDADSFAEIGDADVRPPDRGSPAYRARWQATRNQTGLDESVLVGTALISGYECVVIASAFEFMAGSVGQAGADRIVAAYAYAADFGLPVVALPCSGGTRLQEGTAAFFRMVDIAAAVERHHRSGLCSITWLRHPTTGGVLATWGSLGQVTFAEPRALIGFLGPRIFKELTGDPFPGGIQTAEHLVDVGVIDDIVALGDLRDKVTGILGVVINLSPDPATAQLDLPPPALATVVDCLTSTARPDRPSYQNFLDHCTNVTELHGTAAGERSNALRIALAQIDGVGCVVVGQDRAGDFGDSRLGPGALRQARRGFALAEQLRLPIVTIVDTQGAELSAGAESQALAGEIGRCLAQLSAATVPSIGVLLGRGCGGGALALLATDVVVAAQHGWISPLPLEGAALIRFGSVKPVVHVAQDMGVDANALLKAGIVDVVVAELPDAALEPVAFLARMHAVIGDKLRGARYG